MENNPNDPNKLRLLYDAMAADEVFSQVVPNSFEGFISEYKDPNKLRTLYDALKADEVFSQVVPATEQEAMVEYGLGKPSAVPPSASGSAMPIVNSPMPTEQPEDIQSTQSSAPQYLSPEELGGVQMLPSETSPEQIKAEQQGIVEQSKEFTANKSDVPSIQKQAVIKRAEALDNIMNSDAVQNAIQQGTAEALAQDEGVGMGKLRNYTSGVASLFSGIMRTPEFVYDVITAQTPSLIPYTESIKKGTGMNALEEGAQSLSEYSETLNAAQKKKYDKGISDAISDGNYSDAADMIGDAIAQSAPVTISLIFGNAAGMTGTASTLTGGAVFGAQKKAELDKEFPNMSEEQKNAISLAYGITEGFFEQFGVTQLGQITKAALKKMSKEEATDLAKKSFIQAYGGVLRKYFGVTTEEALSEAATQFAQNAIDKYAGVNPDKDLMEGVADAFIVGGAMGGAMSTPAAAADFAKTKKARTKVAEVAEKREQLRASLQDPNLPDAAKQAISDKIKDLNVEEAEAVQPDMDAYRALPETDKAKVDDLVTKTNEIEASLENPEIPEETKAVLEEKVKEYQDEIQGVLSKEEAAKEPALTEQPLGAETGLVTFVYENDSDVPDVFKDKISSRGETNGKQQIRVTVPKSFANEQLSKAELQNTPTEQAPTEITSTDFEQFDLRGKEGRQAREQLRTKYGAEAVSRMEDITKNFEQTISDLEKQGKIRKECP